MAATLGENAVKQLGRTVRYVENQRKNQGAKQKNKYRPPVRGRRLKLCKTDAAHALDASGVVSLYSGTPGSETDTGINVTAFNKFADLAASRWAWIDYNGPHAYLVAGRCTV